MKYKVDDEVITKVTKGDVPSGTFGVVDSVEGKDIFLACVRINLQLQRSADRRDQRQHYRLK